MHSKTHTHKDASRQTLVLESTDVQRLVSEIGPDQIMDQLIGELENTLLSSPTGSLDIPIRSGFNYQVPVVGLVEWMPIFELGEKITIKVVAYHPDNPNTQSMPTILSSIYQFDSKTGHLTTIMDGVLSTALRTGAASALVSKYLAHPDSQTMGMIGCGAQAITQIHAMSRVFDLEEVLYLDTDEVTEDSLLHRLSIVCPSIGLRKASLKEIVESSDILCTATSIGIGEGPLWDELHTKEHLHINAVGSDFPGKIEVPLSILKTSTVVPDFLAQAVLEGECQQLASEDIGPDIIEVIRNKDKYQGLQSQKTVFDSTGWALEDHVAVEMLRKLAAQSGIGSFKKIEYFPLDVKNPYDFLQTSEEDQLNKEESISLVN